LTALITGDTGTGKEVVARAVHQKSKRKDGPFVVLDCGAIPRELIESTLFGHEKGAFTGAVGQHKGCFEQAQKGTIFLDEIGELDLALQPKLLRVLENRELKRVGGSQTISVDVRVLAATNRDLRRMVSEGTFREDLYFRLSVIQVEIPPLRNRPEDIPQLANHFLQEVAKARAMDLRLDPDALKALKGLMWPGNVRELRNVVERAASLSDGPVITRSDLMTGKGMPVISEADMPTGPLAAAGPLAQFDPGKMAESLDFKGAKQQVVEEFEKEYLKALSKKFSGNITRSAEHAGLTRYHLRELLKRYGITT
jgi:transcriptional regulator with GAF, ATPase, and Fis domain